VLSAQGPFGAKASAAFVVRATTRPISFEGDPFVTEQLDRLLKQARNIKMTPAQQEEQRRSFAYGNTKIENDLITREMIDEAAERLARKK